MTVVEILQKSAPLNVLAFPVSPCDVERGLLRIVGNGGQRAKGSAVSHPLRGIINVLCGDTMTLTLVILIRIQVKGNTVMKTR